MTFTTQSFAKTGLLMAGLCTLTACGNAATGLGPTTTRQSAEGSVTVSETGEFTANGVAVTGQTQNTDPALAGSTFTYYDGPGVNDPTMFFGRTSSAYAGVYSDEFETVPAQGAMAGRIGTTDIPASGSASYTGEYRGIISQERFSGSGVFDNTEYLVVGDARLSANFLTGTISGSITDRDLFEEGTLTASSAVATDLTLGSSSFDDQGRFGGTVTGGSLLIPGAIPQRTTSATYSGLLAGSNSQEVAGTTLIEYGTPLQPGFAESGVFIAVD